MKCIHTEEVYQMAAHSSLWGPLAFSYPLVDINQVPTTLVILYLKQTIVAFTSVECHAEFYEIEEQAISRPCWHEL